MPREDFIKEYMAVRSKSFKPTTIISAFRTSGCWPVNRDVFTDEDYAPSIPTSTVSRHVPSSFPVGVQNTQELDDESDDEYPDPANYPMEHPDSDDELSSNDAGDAIYDSENLQTGAAITPAVSQPLSAPVFSHHRPLTPPVVSNSTSAVHVSSVVMKPIPPTTFYASTTRPLRQSKRKPASASGHSATTSSMVQAQLDTLSQAYSDLSQQMAELRSENSTLTAHCTIARTEIQDLKRILNAKANKPQKRRKLNVDARWLNSDEGLRLAEEQEALRAAEERKKREAREQREAKEAEREVQRRQRDPNAPFTGTLFSKTKADLQDIAQVLGLTMDGQKKDILARISTHFDANPILRDDSRFEGIFNRTRRRPAMQTEGETSNTTGPTPALPAFGAGPSSSAPPAPPPPLSSNIVNTHHFLYTSPDSAALPYHPIPPHRYSNDMNTHRNPY
jgi:hypothetical protein